MKELSNIQLYTQPMSKLNVSTRLLDQPVQLHLHNFYELELVLEGSGANWINGVSLPLSRGLLYLLVPGDTHQIDFDEPLYLIHVGFLPDEENNLSVPLPDGGCVANLNESEMATIMGYFSVAEAEYNSHEPYRYQAAFSALSLILIHLLRHGRMCTGESSFQKLQPALMYIWKHCSDPTLNLQKVADSCGFSASYFSYLFHKTFGSSFSAYLIECRLRCACYLLSETEMSITDVVYECGFSSPSRFFRVFKSRFQCTPGDYRQRQIRNMLPANDEYVPSSLWRHGEHIISAKVDTDESYLAE